MSEGTEPELKVGSQITQHLPIELWALWSGPWMSGNSTDTYVSLVAAKGASPPLRNIRLNAGDW